MSFCNSKFHSNLLLSKKEILCQVILQSRPLLNDSKIDFCEQNAIFTWLYPLKEICVSSGAVFMLISGAPPLVKKCWAKFGFIQTGFWEWKRKLGGREGWLSGRLFVKANTCCGTYWATWLLFKKQSTGRNFSCFLKTCSLTLPWKRGFYYLRELRSLFIGKKGTKRGAGSGSPGESSQKQAGQEKIPEAEGSFHGNKWLHSLPTRSAQSYFLLLQNLLHQLTAEFGCGWAGMSVSMAHTHSSSPSIFKMQTA